MKLPNDYDSHIEKYRNILPKLFVKTLIYFESGFDPNSDMGKVREKKGKKWLAGSAKGLMQIVGGAIDYKNSQSVVKDFNEKFGLKLTYKDLFDPEINIEIGCFTLNNIVKQYSKNFPSVLGIDWSSGRYIELVVNGWNSGYSLSGGVQKVVSYLVKKGMTKDEITIENVYKYAKEAGAHPLFWDIETKDDKGVQKYNPILRMKWAKKVSMAFSMEGKRLEKLPPKCQ